MRKAPDSDVIHVAGHEPLLTEEQERSRLNVSRLDIARCLPFMAIHLMCFAVIWVGWSWTAVSLAVAAYVIRMFAITGFYHRYFAHRTFSVSRFWQFFFAAVGAASTQRGPIWWAAHHRQHHRYADTARDPHSAVGTSIFWSHMGWFMSIKNYAVRRELVPDLLRFPELVFIDKYDVLVPAVFGFSTFFVGWLLGQFVPSLGTNGMQMLIWVYFISTVFLYHGTFTINSLAHRFGSRRFAVADTSRNNFFLALITLGEGWHNNHHYCPATARQGFFWWEIDMTYYGLCVLQWLGVVSDLRPVPEKVYVESARRRQEVRAARQQAA